MKTAKQQVLTLAERLNASIEYGDIGIGNVFEILIDAPDGWHWAGDGVHQVVESRWHNELIANLWQDALERIEYGLEPCDDDCDQAMRDLSFAKQIVEVVKNEEARPAN